MKNWIRTILGGLSLTSMMFVFQACYGTPQDFGHDLLIEGQVIAEASGAPVEGIKVSVANNAQYQMTDEEGQFSFYTERIDGLTLQFQDVDSTQNGLFVDKDTVLTELRENMYLDIALEQE
ncbi:MAG: carboxypeptidase-like regulatory domain-containing protein [Bacteroidales bacterium]